MTNLTIITTQLVVGRKEAGNDISDPTQNWNRILPKPALWSGYSYISAPLHM